MGRAGGDSEEIYLQDRRPQRCFQFIDLENCAFREEVAIGVADLAAN
jgi:hypothetical protein